MTLPFAVVIACTDGPDAMSSPKTTRRCSPHQLSPASTAEPQNMPRRNGIGSPWIHLQPRKSASVSVPTTTGKPLRCA